MLTSGSQSVLYQFMTHVVHILYHKDSKATICFVKWGLVAVHDDEIYPTIFLFRGENWFHLCEYAN
jgi:hypothetical protein